MKRVEIIGISIFVALCLGGIALSIWNQAKTRQRVTRYSALRRGTVLGFEDEVALQGRLNAVTPDMRWTVVSLVPVHPPPRGLYFFGFRQSGISSRSGTSEGFASFAERGLNQPGQAVEIDPRVPLLSKLVENKVETGSAEFRHQYTVSCRDSALAQAAVTPELQRVLLDHVANRKWGVAVIVGAGGVLVRTPYAKRESDWDYITVMALKLRDALH